MATVTETAAHGRWEKENAAAPPREQPPTTVSGVPIEPLYTPESLNGFDPDTDLGFPGQYPSRAAFMPPCTAAGCGPCGSSLASAHPRQTNERFKFLLAKGQTGLSTAFDCRP